MVDKPVRLVAEEVWQQQYQQYQQHQQQHEQAGAAIAATAAGTRVAGLGRGVGAAAARPPAAQQLPPQPGVVSRPGVVVCTLRPPVVVMNSRWGVGHWVNEAMSRGVRHGGSCSRPRQTGPVRG